MKLLYCIFSLNCLLGSCSSVGTTPLGQTSQVLEYPIQDKQYAIVILMDEGMSEEQARDLARQKAAELTVKNGFRYFTVEKESKVQVIKSNQPFPDAKAFPGNLYEELIVEKDFTRERVANAAEGGSSFVPGFRWIIQCSEERSSSKAVDACTLTDCQK